MITAADSSEADELRAEMHTYLKDKTSIRWRYVTGPDGVGITRPAFYADGSVTSAHNLPAIYVLRALVHADRQRAKRRSIYEKP